jgi:hypothetical protein
MGVLRALRLLIDRLILVSNKISERNVALLLANVKDAFVGSTREKEKTSTRDLDNLSHCFYYQCL